MTEIDKKRLRTNLDAYLVNVHKDKSSFRFKFNDWELELKLHENDMKLFRPELIVHNLPNDCDKQLIHYDDSACLGIDRDEYVSLNRVLEKICDWINNAWQLHHKEKITDHGYRHGWAAFFEAMCSKYGLIFDIETFDSLNEEHIKEMLTIARKYLKYRDLDSNAIYLSIKQGVIDYDKNK